MWIWRAFEFIHRSRVVGYGGPLPITPSEILAYCELAGIYGDEERDDLIEMIPHLDNHWLEAHYKKAEKERKKLQQKSKSSPKR